MAEAQQKAGAAETTCYRHSGRQTAVSCSDCGRPICTDCMVYSAVGIKCPECARQPRSARVRIKPGRLARALAAAGFGGLAIGVLMVQLQSVGLFFALIFGYLIGVAMAELVLWASGRFRGRETALIALGGAIWSYLTPYIFSFGFNLGVVADTLARSPFVLLGVAIAGYVAYNRAS